MSPGTSTFSTFALACIIALQASQPAWSQSQAPQAVDASRPGPVALQPWAARSLNLKIISQDVRTVLKLIGGEAGVPITVDQGLTTPVTDLALTGPVPAVLDRLAEAAGLVWWWNGAEVRVVDRRDLQVRIWQIGDPVLFKRLVRDIGVPDGAVQYQSAGELGLLRVSGPRALLSELEPVMKIVAARAGEVKVTRYGKTTVTKTN